MTDLAEIYEEQESRVLVTQELLRIKELPRRTYSEADQARLQAELEDVLGLDGRTMKMRAVQALSLHELGTHGGLFGPQRVGAGKTLSTLLAAVVARAQRPLLLIPAKLVPKTDRDRAALARQWWMAPFLRIMTYEWLGRLGAAELRDKKTNKVVRQGALQEYQADLIAADEAHKLKNPDAAVTKRVRRYLREREAIGRRVKFACFSGTMMKRSLHDFAHLLRWALGDGAPIPKTWDDLCMWADALDERKNQQHFVHPGALEVLCNSEERALWRLDPKTAARQAFGRRLAETAGVVATVETGIDATLTIESVEPPLAPAVDRAFETLRDAWQTPDGWEVSDGLGQARHARELALGFYYVWEPRPPIEWLRARQAWHKHVREVLKHSRKLDSMLQVALSDPAAEELVDWKKVEKLYKVKTVPVWIDDSVMQWAAEWCRREKGIVWCEHVCVGERLRELGVDYYGAEGKNANRRMIEHHPTNEGMAASIEANYEGRNLQAWNTNLILGCPPNGQRLEQLLARTHRDFQEADEVQFDIAVSCAEHVGAFWQCVKDSEAVEQTMREAQKVLIAGKNYTTPDELAKRFDHARWNKFWRRPDTD